jgi:hypothetical protein
MQQYCCGTSVADMKMIKNNHRLLMNVEDFSDNWIISYCRRAARFWATRSTFMSSLFCAISDVIYELTRWTRKTLSNNAWPIPNIWLTIYEWGLRVVFFCISENGKLYLKKRAGIGYSSCLMNIHRPSVGSFQKRLINKGKQFARWWCSFSHRSKD